jgi:hypothetical protein
MSESPRNEALTVAGIALAACVPYAGSVGYGFTFDDANCILGHPGVGGPLSFENLLLRDNWGLPWFMTVGNWRPLATFSYWLDWHLGDGRASIFHVDNLLLYALVLVLYALFLKRFFARALTPGARLLAVAAAGALATHCDVVPSATGRSEILAALFAFVALVAPLRDGPIRARDVVFAAVASTLAACAKESALPVSLLTPLLAYRWHRARGTDQRTGMTALTAACTAGLCGVVVFRVLRMPWWGLGPKLALEDAVMPTGSSGRLWGAAEVLVRYLGHVLYPARLAPDYGYAGIVPGHAPMLAAVGVALGAATAATILGAWNRPPGVADALLGFGAAYAVVSHVIVPASTVLADRLFFFPSFWLVTVVALAASGLQRSRTFVGTAAVAFALIQAAVAARTSPRWRDDVTLLTAAVEARPTVQRLRRDLAQVLADRGRPEDAAWQLAVSKAILGLLPEPLPEDDFPVRWDGQPVEARLTALRERVGQPALRDALRHSIAVAMHWGYPEVATVLRAWERQEGG